MTPRRWPGWIARCWPQKVRTRLTLIYAVLFLAGGSALLGLTYTLVARSLPAAPAAASLAKKQSVPRARQFEKCKQQAQGKKIPKSVLRQCQTAYAAGASAGSQDQRDRALHSLLVYSLVGLGVMTLASGGAGWVVSGRVLRPVRAITATARRASEQHLGERLGLTGARDELKELADTFDDMLERLDRAFGAQRRFVASASHELRTPLTVMRTAIDVTLAKPGRTPQQIEAMAIRVRRSIDRAEAMIDALLTLAVSDQGPASSEPFDLATAAEDALDVAAASIAQQGLQVDSELAPAQTSGDPLLLERMIGNLIDNAVRHNEPGGWIALRTGVSDGTVFLRIANSGPHVPQDAVPALFEPFQRMQGRTGSGDGAGLGLSIARSIGAAHDATVVARSQPEGGLDVRVALRCCDPDTEQNGPAGSGLPPRGT
jgi:signal transduction histidine kinase